MQDPPLAYLSYFESLKESMYIFKKITSNRESNYPLDCCNLQMFGNTKVISMYAVQYFNNNTDLIQLSLDCITTKDLEYDNFQ